MPAGVIGAVFWQCTNERTQGAAMKIGIIGAGQIGGILTRKLVQLGHTVSVANSRGPESLAALARESGARAVTVADAVKNVDLVVVTIPQKSVPLLPKGLFHGLPEALIVVDTGNYYPSFRDGPIAAIEGGTTESGWVAQQLGHPVVKTFNNIMAPSLAEGGLPAGTAGRIALPIAGDDRRAKEVVIGLVDALGFDGIDAGSLDESWRQQPGTPAYCTDLDATQLRRALARADRKRAPVVRELSIAKMQTLPPNSTPRDVVRLVRELADEPGQR
jgi:predicted dinucleotide-binding enzyme